MKREQRGASSLINGVWVTAFGVSFYESCVLTRFHEDCEGRELAKHLIPNWDARWTPRAWRAV